MKDIRNLFKEEKTLSSFRGLFAEFLLSLSFVGKVSQLPL